MDQKTYTPVFEYKQNNQHYLSVVLPHELIDSNSEVLVYGDNPAGYQREPEPTHYNKIKDYIIHTKNFILPTSIVLAIDEEELSNLLSKKSSITILTLDNKSSKKIFRIVDGQHRIIAMREAIKLNPTLNKFLFNVIILITKSNKRSVEMEVFYDINSKSKRLKVDLIELARFNYRILEKSFKEKELNEHIAIQTAYYLNEKVDDCIWNNAIKFGIHDEQVIGIIGVNAFRESIYSIVDIYLKMNDNSKYKKLETESLINYTKEAAKFIADFIHEAWDNIIKKKWEYCFKEGLTELDLFFEPKKIYYNQKYYIQRTMGAKALNSILAYTATDGLGPEALENFNKLIKSSNITDDDWILGGAFGGYSSESGFKKVTQFILNNLSVKR